MLRYCLITLLLASVQGYFWENVQTPDSYPVDTLYYQAATGTYGSCGYTDSAVGRFLKGSNRCYVPYNGEEFEVVLPYDVLIAEPFQERSAWTSIFTPEEIREKGVLVCDNCEGGADMYVCASNQWGPGKLIIDTGNGVTCYVSWEGAEHIISDFLTLTAELAIQYILTDVNYVIDALDVLSEEPTQMGALDVENNTEEPQTTTQTLEYEITTSNMWENAYGFIIGVSMSVTAGIPELIGGEWGTSIESSYEYSYGGSQSETIGSSTSVAITVPPRSVCTLRMVARQIVADVPYDATATVQFPDGSTTTEFITGIYEGVSINSASVVYDPCVPI